jgi:hypothetical protein
MKLIVGLLAWLMMPLASLVVAFEVAKAFIEDRMEK